MKRTIITNILVFIALAAAYTVGSAELAVAVFLVIAAFILAD